MSSPFARISNEEPFTLEGTKRVPVISKMLLVSVWNSSDQSSKLYVVREPEPSIRTDDGFTLTTLVILRWGTLTLYAYGSSEGVRALLEKFKNDTYLY